MAKLYKKIEIAVANYESRNSDRERTLITATMSFVGYFITLGDTQATAEAKVSQMSTEVAALIYVYTLGNQQPLIDAINASTLVHMDAAAKAYIVGQLTAA